MKKWLCILLSLTLALSCLAGCGRTAEGEEPSDGEIPEAETPSPSQDAEAPAPTLDLAAARSAYDPDAVVMTVDGVPINWNKYSSALFQFLYTFYAYYGITDFSLELEEGRSIALLAKEYAYGTLSSNAMFHIKAAEEGVSLTEEALSSIGEEIDFYASMYYDGDRDALFAEAGITEEYYRYQAEAALLYEALLAHYYGDNCADFPAEDALAWAEDNEYLHARHILIKTVDDSFNALDEETVAEKRALAEDILGRLEAADASVRDSLFDALMNEFSEDTGLAHYPDGYYFREGDMVAEFYEAALALAPGEMSGIVESYYGCHIIQRLPLDVDQTADYDTATGRPRTLRTMVATELFENMLDEWYGALDIRYEGNFAALDVAALFPETAENG